MVILHRFNVNVGRMHVKKRRNEMTVWNNFIAEDVNIICEMGEVGSTDRGHYSCLLAKKGTCFNGTTRSPLPPKQQSKKAAHKQRSRKKARELREEIERLQKVREIQYTIS